MSVQKIKVKGQGHRGKEFCPQFGHFQTVRPVWIQGWIRNDAQSLKWHRTRGGALLFFQIMITSQLLQDHRRYKATGVLVRSWLKWTSPHVTSPHLTIFAQHWAYSTSNTLIWSFDDNWGPLSAISRSLLFWRNWIIIYINTFSGKIDVKGIPRTPRERSILLSSTPEVAGLPMDTTPLWHGCLLAD